MKRLILITGAVIYLFFVFICLAVNAQVPTNGNVAPLVHIHTVRDIRGNITTKDTSFRLDSNKMHALMMRHVHRLRNHEFARGDSETIKKHIHNRITHIGNGSHRFMNAESIFIERKFTVRGDSMIRDVRRIVNFKPSPEKNYKSADTVITHDVTVRKGVKSPKDIPDTTDPSLLNENVSGNTSSAPGTLDIPELNIYPNPSNGQFKISFTLPDNLPVGLKITDLEGRTVWNDAVNNFSGRYTNNIDMSAQPKAIYILEIMQNNKTMLKKLVVN